MDARVRCLFLERTTDDSDERQSVEPKGDVRLDMDPEHLDELAQLEESYWWHVAKRELIVELLQRHAPPAARLVEAGAGPGGNLVAFKAQGYEVAGLDILQEAVEQCRARNLFDVFQH